MRTSGSPVGEWLNRLLKFDMGTEIPLLARDEQALIIRQIWTQCLSVSSTV